MKQYCAAISLATATAIAAMCPLLVHASQDQHPNASNVPVVQVRVDTIVEFINQIAGLRLRVVSGIVDDVASPRVFTLKGVSHTRYVPLRVVVVLGSGGAVVREGAPLVVTGVARTLLGAEMTRDQPLSALNEAERKLIANLPVVVASSVETPDGVDLVRLQP